MGTSLSRQNAAVEEADVSLNHPYKYPPKTGIHKTFTCFARENFYFVLHNRCDRFIFWHTFYYGWRTF